MEESSILQQPASLFKARYSLAIRLWHWLTFLTMLASIIMVLLASTMFTTRYNIPMVQEQIQSKNESVSQLAARAVAHEYTDKLWMAHKYIGYGLCFLLLCRIIIEITYSREKRLGNKIRKAFAFQTQNRFQSKDRKHYLWVKWGYVVFYLLFLIMALTGLGLAFEDVPIFRSTRGALGDVHEIVQYLIYAYLFFHIAGVIRADVTDNRGIVSDMINGGKD
jgi:Ni/Fe-hydrogenase 1 B-type cytochrome subunit